MGFVGTFAPRPNRGLERQFDVVDFEDDGLQRISVGRDEGGHRVPGRIGALRGQDERRLVELGSRLIVPAGLETSRSPTMSKTKNACSEAA